MADGQPWGSLCQTDSSGKQLRVLAPADYVSQNPSAFSSYWTAYINQVWSTYTNQPLYIDTQVAAGVVKCQVTNNVLNCAGDNRGYNKPTASDIFGCNSGPFSIIAGQDNGIHYAVVPRLCAAFHRTTFLLPGGNTQPSLGPSSYYTQEPTDYFSKFVHELELDNKGYAFAYDDVSPNNSPSQAGVVTDGNPSLFTVVVGGES